MATATVDVETMRSQALEMLLRLAVGYSLSCQDAWSVVMLAPDLVIREEALGDLEEVTARLHVRLLPVASAWLAELPASLVDHAYDVETLSEALPGLFRKAGIAADLVELIAHDTPH